MVQTVPFISKLCQFTSRPVRIIYVGENAMWKPKPCFNLIFLETKASMCPDPPCWETECPVTVLLPTEPRQTGCGPLLSLALGEPPALSSPAAGTVAVTCSGAVNVDGGLHISQCHIHCLWTVDFQWIQWIPLRFQGISLLVQPDLAYLDHKSALTFWHVGGISTHWRVS